MTGAGGIGKQKAPVKEKCTSSLNVTLANYRGGLPFAVCCSRPYIVYVNLPRQHIFRDSFLTRQTGAGEQCSPLQEFFDSLNI